MVLRQAESYYEDVRPIFIYCLESPLCYHGNLAMRSVKGDPFQEPKGDEKLFVNTYWEYEKTLLVQVKRGKRIEHWSQYPE